MMEKVISKIVALCLLVFLPLAARGQEIQITPMSLDFGRVPLGESATIPLTLVSMWPYTPLCFYGAYFQYSEILHNPIYNRCSIGGHPGYPNGTLVCDNESAELTVSSTIPNPVPDDLWQYDQLVLEVTYTPTTLGPPPAAVLNIDSNDHRGGYNYLPITGEGVEPIPDPETPAELLDDIIALFDDAKEQGTVNGTGRCDRMREKRLKTMRLFLTAAERHLDDERIRAACRALQWANVGSDGIALDWIEGDDVSTLNTLIVSLMETLRCNG